MDDHTRAFCMALTLPFLSSSLLLCGLPRCPSLAFTSLALPVQPFCTHSSLRSCMHRYSPIPTPCASPRARPSVFGRARLRLRCLFAFLFNFSHPNFARFSQIFKVRIWLMFLFDNCNRNTRRCAVWGGSRATNSKCPAPRMHAGGSGCRLNEQCCASVGGCDRDGRGDQSPASEAQTTKKKQNTKAASPHAGRPSSGWWSGGGGLEREREKKQEAPRACVPNRAVWGRHRSSSSRVRWKGKKQNPKKKKKKHRKKREGRENYRARWGGAAPGKVHSQPSGPALLLDDEALGVAAEHRLDDRARLSSASRHALNRRARRESHREALGGGDLLLRTQGE